VFDALTSGATQFALEQDLQRYLADNLNIIVRVIGLRQPRRHRVLFC
jgi:hypothetical protein